MRAPVLAVIIAALVAGCASPEPDAGPTPAPAIPEAALDGWVEFHPNWARGGTFVWMNETYRVNESEEWASLDESYFYGRAVGAGKDHAACVQESPPSPAAHAYVFIGKGSRGCIWAEHPGSGCFQAEFCKQRTLPGGPPPRT